MELTEQEQGMLDAAGIALVTAQAKHQQASQEVEQMRQQINVLGGRVEGTLRTILLLRGVNPDAYAASFDPSTERFVVAEVAERATA